MRVEVRNLINIAVISICAISIGGAMANEELLESDSGKQWLSAKGLYKVSYISALDPIEINRIHNWILHVTMADGQPVENADIEVTGGMPAHNHGLPTRPRVTDNLGDGNYRVAGIRFHMQGRWEMRIIVRAEYKTDVVVLSLQL